MKNYLQNTHFRKIENRNFAGLKAGIKTFWKTLYNTYSLQQVHKSYQKGHAYSHTQERRCFWTLEIF